jgi:predicted DNA-binding transcriptional regulator YafY
MHRKPIKMRYTNYRGEVSIREITPTDVPQFLPTEYHPEPQWIIRAWDYGKQDYRDFALCDCDFTVSQKEPTP